MWKPHVSAWALGLCAVLHSSAGAVTPAEQAYLGGYTQGSVDAQSQLMLLDDNTFCFRFMGGATDMVAAGRWQSLPGKGAGVHLQEVRLPEPQFPAFAKVGPGQSVQFDFHGYSLGESLAPVFGVSATAALPKTLRPLFDSEHQSWAESYKLPHMPADSAQYFYIGQMEMDARHVPQRVVVTQYRLPADNHGAGTVRIGFNVAQARPMLNMVATLKGEVLLIDGQRFGVRDDLNAELVQQIRSFCVAPVLVPGTQRPRNPDDEEDEEPQSRIPALVPLKTFYLKPGDVKGAPYFPSTKD
jgi:hypothetical protein